MIRLSGMLLLFIVPLLVVAQEPELILPAGNSNQMQAMAISHDEKMLASADLDGKIKIWEAGTGKLLKTVLHRDIYNIAFTPDDQALVITSFTAPEVFFIASGKSIVLGDAEYCDGIALSPDGKLIVVASSDSVYAWDAKSFRLLFTLPAHGNADVKFSPDGKLLVTFGTQNIELWSLEKKLLAATLKGHQKRVIDIDFDKTTTKLLSASDDNTAICWDLKSGKLLMVYKGHQNTVWNARFHPDGKKIITVSGDNTAKLWDRLSGKLIKTITEHKDWIYRVKISPDGKTYALSDLNGICTVWNAATDQLSFSFRAGTETLYYLEYLKNGKQIVAGNYDPLLTRWNIVTKQKEITYGLTNERFTAIALSNDEKYVLTTSRSGIVRKIEAATGKVIFNSHVFNGWATSAAFSPDDKMVVVAGGDPSSVLLDSEGGMIDHVNDHTSSYESTSQFSPDGKYLLHEDNQNVQLVSIDNNKRLLTIDSISMFTKQRFSPDGRYIITGGQKTVKVWSVVTRELVQRVTVETDFPTNIGMSRDAKHFFCFDGFASTLWVWETENGKLVRKSDSLSWAGFASDQENLVTISLKGLYTRSTITGEEQVQTLQLSNWIGRDFGFTGDGEMLLFKQADSIVATDLKTGRQLKKISGEEIAYGKSGRYCYVLSDDMMEAYILPSFELVYRHYVTGDKTDYLVEDDLGRYDGTEAARKLLYFVCGKEVIELAQAKDQLWVPNLAERKMKGDNINAKNINELNICGLSPEVENIKTDALAFYFKITPKRGGLGETVVFVNGIEAKRYKPEQLTKKGSVYELQIRKEELKNFFISGKENPVNVKAYTQDNAIASRGLIVSEDKRKEPVALPNLYAVMVGVSDYKGDELDLKYAAKDAADISAAIAVSAKKLLNTDGKEHVFMYDLTTAKEHYQLPEKNSIKKILQEIGKKATASDILLIFFAGHGVMGGEDKQFYFLTADASSMSATGALADVGISTAELTEWMKPQQISAQKRILIFDACNSGQAIKDFVKIGTGEQEYVKRSDDAAQQIKAIDKLNEKAGLIILSASASNQSAYEMSRYSQGLLTYSLLLAIKQQPDILEEGKYLNLSRWFDAAEKTVTAFSKENGARQEPQLFTNTNFNIGIVDKEVMAAIQLPDEKPLFAASNFQNSDEAADGDNLDLSKLINQQLFALSARDVESKIIYVMATNSPDAVTMSGRYDVKGNEVLVRVSLKINNETKYRFEGKGTKDKLKELALELVVKATDWAAAKQ